MIRGIGVDSVASARLAALLAAQGYRLWQRLCTEAEAQYCRSRARPAESLAARFAAKEAAMKCLGTGWSAGVGFRDVEVTRNDDGAVGLRLVGAAAARAAALGIERWHVSLTHTDDVATAFVVAEGGA
ncbi:MAG: holo-ACP synthase [Planctomycetota bacterium]